MLVHAFREDAPRFPDVRPWLERALESEEPIGVSDFVLSAFLRVVTHPGAFRPPTPLDAALEFAEALRAHPNTVIIRPGERHWSIFTRLCAESDARGNLVPDAFLAALAIESGSEWVTTDRDFSKFPGLRLRTPGS